MIYRKNKINYKMGLVGIRKNILYLFLLIIIIVVSLFYGTAVRGHLGTDGFIEVEDMKEALTTADSSNIIEKILYDAESDSIKKINTLRSVISMMNIQDTYTYNSIIFDTTISDDAKIKRAKQLVDNKLSSSNKTNIRGNVVVSGTTQ